MNAKPFPLEPFKFSQADWVKAKALVALRRWRTISEIIDDAFGDAEGLGEGDSVRFLEIS